MSPRNKKSEIKSYRPVLSIAARDAFTDLAAALRFTVAREGMYHGLPSVTDMLEALATAYERDPAGVKLVMKTLGVTPDGKPSVVIGDTSEE